MVSSAVVLGAGGPAGIAWETGVAAGLADGGIDLRDAEVFVGTSAGSIVAAGLASGVSLEMLFARQADPREQVAELKAPLDWAVLRTKIQAAKRDGGTKREILTRVGALALAAATVAEDKRRDVIAARLASHTWPRRDLRVVAVDAHSGERVVFDAGSGVELIDAVAASCAVPGVWPPVTIGDRRYIDGGAYSTDSADLAAGAGRAIILALRAVSPPLGVVSLDQALEVLRTHGTDVRIVQPDEATEAVFASVGGNLLDPAVRGAAARAGREQGRRLTRGEDLAAWQPSGPPPAEGLVPG